MIKLESNDQPIFERGAQFAGTFLERGPKGNRTFARWNVAGESSILKLVKFSLGNRSLQVFTQDAADRHGYSIGDETQDVKQNENRLLGSANSKVYSSPLGIQPIRPLPSGSATIK